MPSDHVSALSSKGPRLDFLDGLRGFAAFMVVLHHVTAFVAVPRLFAVVSGPNPWVAIFITLSGFCLYLPAAARPSVQMPRPFVPFMLRRAQRIIPAWYASLALCILTGGILLAAHAPNASAFLPVNVWDLPAHLLLIHSMFRYSGTINGPGYTLGMEWQLYLWMTVMIAACARIGWIGLLLIVAGLCLPISGFLPLVIHHLLPGDFAVPFVLGMTGARLARLPRATTSQRQGELLLLAAALALGIFLFFQPPRGLQEFSQWAAGLATASGCVLMARQPRGLIARLFASQSGQTLGGFSYSLYLTHFPLLALTGCLAVKLALTPQESFLWVFLPALPLIFGFGYLFSLVFERPYLNRRLAAIETASAPAAPAAVTPQKAAEQAAVETW